MVGGKRAAGAAKRSQPACGSSKKAVQYDGGRKWAQPGLWDRACGEFAMVASTPSSPAPCLGDLPALPRSRGAPRIRGLSYFLSIRQPPTRRLPRRPTPETVHEQPRLLHEPALFRVGDARTVYRRNSLLHGPCSRTGRLREPWGNSRTGSSTPRRSQEAVHRIDVGRRNHPRPNRCRQDDRIACRLAQVTFSPSATLSSSLSRAARSAASSSPEASTRTRKRRSAVGPAESSSGTVSAKS